ncbi:MAG: hypothetical protein HGA45_10415 [Chloroflexales bacterium]|nr:hypothetical protein [Chloroflexales bacterium]
MLAEEASELYDLATTRAEELAAILLPPNPRVTPENDDGNAMDGWRFREVSCRPKLADEV